MGEHDKGGALPGGFQLPQSTEGTKRRANERRLRIAKRRAEMQHHSKRERIRDVLRGYADKGFGLTSREVADKARIGSWKLAEAFLNKLVAKRLVATEQDDEGVRTWWIPRKQLKAHTKKLKSQSVEVAKHFQDWTVSSICARMSAGIELRFSYPCSSLPQHSSTTTPLT